VKADDTVWALGNNSGIIEKKLRDAVMGGGEFFPTKVEALLKAADREVLDAQRYQQQADAALERARAHRQMAEEVAKA